MSTVSSFSDQREEMVRKQVIARGVVDRHVLAAMREVPREVFVGDRYHEFAYEDSPLPIEEGQTISQPYIVALMIEAAHVRPGDNVLEVGAGSGYASAVLSRIAQHVHALEWHRPLADVARSRLRRLGYRNVTVLQGDGSIGCPAHAPFDVIIVSAGGPDVPEPLLRQLCIGGRLIIPVGHEPRTQELLKIERTGENQFERESLGQVRFVPLIGTEGWAADGRPIAAQRAAAPVRIHTESRERMAKAIAAACEPIIDLETT